MSERMTDEECANAVNLAQQWWTPEHVGVRLAFEVQRSRASETAHAAEIERLKAELARLTPTGQVAEDERLIRAKFPAVPVMWVAVDAALSRLAAKAHGYSAAVARAEEAEKQARLAWERHAEKDRAYGDMISQRDAAVADNAALLKVARGFESMLQDFVTNYHAADAVFASQEEAAADLAVIRADHPGTTLLKERQEREEVVKALEGALTTIAERGVSSTDRRIARNALLLTRWLP